MAPIGTAYGFTGELTDGNGMVYLRARYLAPGLGTFASRDPWRGTASAPRTWNGYMWVEGNVVNRVDPGGMASCMATANPVASTQVAAIPCDLVPEAEREALRLVGACAYDSALKDASVVVQYFYNGQPNADGTSCVFPDNTPGLANHSLGVLTEAGLWTHDHFDILSLIQDAEGNTRIDPHSRRVAADTAQAAEFLRSYGCVELRGSRGTQVLSNVTADLAASGSGFLHVPLESPETIGVPISMGNLPPEGANARIQFAYIRNTNERCIINNGVTLANPIETTATGCAWSDIEIGGAESSFSIQSVNPQDIGPRLGVEFRGTGYAGAIEALPTQGDSGGGFFYRGQFIGLMLAGPAAAGGRGTYYFSPVRR